jgi:hypothetical protein
MHSTQVPQPEQACWHGRGRRGTVTCADALAWTPCLLMACKRSGIRIPKLHSQLRVTYSNIRLPTAREAWRETLAPPWKWLSTFRQVSGFNWRISSAVIWPLALIARGQMTGVTNAPDHELNSKTERPFWCHGAEQPNRRRPEALGQPAWRKEDAAQVRPPVSESWPEPLTRRGASSQPS